MTNQTTEGEEPFRSLCSINNEPEQTKKIPVEAIMRKGEIISCSIEAHYYCTYKYKYFLYKIEESCSCCKGNLGILRTIQGKRTFICIGVGCLLKVNSEILC